MRFLRAHFAATREAIDAVAQGLLLLRLARARLLEERLRQARQLQRHERDADDGGGGHDEAPDGRHGRDVAEPDGRERRQAKIQSVEEVRDLRVRAGLGGVDQPRRLRVNYVSDIRTDS